MMNWAATRKHCTLLLGNDCFKIQLVVWFKFPCPWQIIELRSYCKSSSLALQKHNYYYQSTDRPTDQQRVGIMTTGMKRDRDGIKRNATPSYFVNLATSPAAAATTKLRVSAHHKKEEKKSVSDRHLLLACSSAHNCEWLLCDSRFHRQRCEQ